MQPDWERLRTVHPVGLVENLRLQIEQADTSVVDPKLLSDRSNVGFDETMKLLAEVARLGALLFTDETRCGKCGAIAFDEDQKSGICPECGVRYLELDEPFTQVKVFRLPDGRRSRDISWLVTVHGMNTDGPWQQDFSWTIAKRLKYSAPVLIFKYPILRVMALFERTQRLAAADLGQRLRVAQQQASMRVGELAPVPDVILHSYGTLLFSLLLLDERFSDLRFGRVLLAGSIIPPAYDWASHVQRGRIERVINHCGDHDFVVHVAQFLMPNAGPSGKIGFVDRAAVNVVAAGYGHGTFFELDKMQENLRPGGSWDSFLTGPPEVLGRYAAVAGPPSWRESSIAKPVRFVLKTLLLAGFGPLIWLVMQGIAAVHAIIWAR